MTWGHFSQVCLFLIKLNTRAPADPFLGLFISGKRKPVHRCVEQHSPPLLRRGMDPNVLQWGDSPGGKSWTHALAAPAPTWKALCWMKEKQASEWHTVHFHLDNFLKKRRDIVLENSAGAARGYMQWEEKAVTIELQRWEKRVAGVSLQPNYEGQNA